MKSLFSALVFFFIFSQDTLAQNWLPSGFDMNGPPRTLYSDTASGWFYVGGEMSIVDGQKVSRMFRVDESSQIDYMDTINVNMSTVLAFVEYNDTIYHMGSAGLKYFDSTWKSKIEDEVFYNAYVSKGMLYIGGYFINAVSHNDGVVIQYDGTEFSPFQDAKTRFGGPSGESGSVGTFVEYKDKLYIGGSFNDNTSFSYNEIIAWDGQNWDNMKGGIMGTSGFEFVNDLVVYKDELYVGGKFYSNSGSPSNHILKWDGSNWYTIGEGIYGQGIADMLVYNDELWIIGAIDSVSGIELGNIAIWNGSNWCTPEGRIDFMPLCGAVFQDTLYVGGNFKHIDYDSSLAYLVKSNPNAQRKCGADVQIHPVGIEKGNDSHKDGATLYPNPTNGIFWIAQKEAFYKKMSIFKVDGRLIYSQSNLPKSEVLSFDIKLDAGLYFIQIENDHSKHSFKLNVID